jgi:hypothetical protein
LGLLALQGNAQDHSCFKDLCISENQAFKTDVFYQGQNIVIELLTENTSDVEKEYLTTGFEMMFKDGKKEVPVEWFNRFPDRPESTDGDKIAPHFISVWTFDGYFNRIRTPNYVYLDYEKTFKQKNRLPILQPGRYSLERGIIVFPQKKRITAKKEFEIKEPKGGMKKEFLDYLKCVNYYYNIDEKRDSLLERMFDEKLSTITWYMKNHPNSIYSAELFRFFHYDWETTGHKPNFGSYEEDAKIYYALTCLYKDIRGNLAGTTDFFMSFLVFIKGFKRYGLIQDELVFMHNFLAGIADKPVEISDFFIEKFNRKYKDVHFSNYAREKQTKK